MTAARLMLYALCYMLYVLCFISFSVIKAWNNTMSKSMKNPEKVCQRVLDALCPQKPAEAQTLLTIFYVFLDDFLQLYLFCFICSTKFVNAYKVRQCNTKVCCRFWGWGGGGVCVCKSYSMDSLLLSKM